MKKFMPCLFVSIIVAAAMSGSVQAAGEPMIRPVVARLPFGQLQHIPHRSSHFEGAVICIDDDVVGGAPARWRTILVEAAYPCGVDEICYIATEYDFNVHDGASLLSFDDPAWSAWRDWLPVADENRFVYELDEFDGEGRRIHYLLALQAMDQDGTVSTILDYASTAHNIHVGQSTPTLYRREPGFRRERFFPGRTGRSITMSSRASFCSSPGSAVPITGARRSSPTAGAGTWPTSTIPRIRVGPWRRA